MVSINLTSYISLLIEERTSYAAETTELAHLIIFLDPSQWHGYDMVCILGSHRR
jgi:hypothetical protein